MQQRPYPPRSGEGRRTPDGPQRSATRRPPAGPPRDAAPRPSGARPRPDAAQRPRSSPPGARSAPRPQNRSQDPRRRPAPPQGRRPAPRRRPRRRLNFKALVLLICIAVVLIYVIHFLSVVGVGTPKFIDNVTINGISLAGMSHEDGVAYLDDVETQWLNESYELNYLDRSWSFSRALVNANVDFESQAELAWNLGHIGNVFERKRTIDATARNPVFLTAAVTYDESLLDAFVASIAADIDVAPVDAVIAADVDRPEIIVESATGLAVNQEQLKGQLITLIETGESDTTIPVETQFPAVQADSENYKVIASFSTDVSFRGSASKSNVRLALNAFNGICVLPGEEISFNKIVGPRTEANGFKKATEYAGDTTTTGWGGGVCQASTTLYNALIMADMHVIERHQHSMTVSYVDPSNDAAIYEDARDLRFENDTGNPIYIYTSVTDDLATVTIYGTKPEYNYVLESVIIEENVKSTRKTYIDDTSGTHVYYKDETPVLQSKGKSGCVSEGWIVAYDWDTGAEVSRVKVSVDTYKPGASVYWRGVHDRAQVGLITEY